MEQRGRDGGEERNNAAPTGADAPPATTNTTATTTTNATLHRSLPSDPDLAERVLAVPDSAAQEVKRILLNLASEKNDKENDSETETETAALVAEFLSSPNADATINQFLRAVGGKDAEAAVARLIATMQWRREANPAETSCEECKKVKRVFFLCFFFLENKETKTHSLSFVFIELPSQQDPRSHYMHV